VIYYRRRHAAPNPSVADGCAGSLIVTLVRVDIDSSLAAILKNGHGSARSV
jgi:hypothetical protein